MAQGSRMQRSTVGGFGPWHCLSGNVAMVREKSRYILHSTSRLRIPSPHVTLHGPHFSGMKLKIKKLV